MNYIIDPRWFYFINIVGNLQAFMIIAAICLVAAGGIILGVLYAESGFKNCPKEARLGKVCITVGIVLALALVFIPSKETLIEMEIAKHVTYDSTETAVQMIHEATDYILEKTGGKESK